MYLDINKTVYSVLFYPKPAWKRSYEDSEGGNFIMYLIEPKPQAINLLIVTRFRTGKT